MRLDSSKWVAIELERLGRISNEIKALHHDNLLKDSILSISDLALSTCESSLEDHLQAEKILSAEISNFEQLVKKKDFQLFTTQSSLDATLKLSNHYQRKFQRVKRGRRLAWGIAFVATAATVITSFYLQ